VIKPHRIINGLIDREAAASIATALRIQSSVNLAELATRTRDGAHAVAARQRSPGPGNGGDGPMNPITLVHLDSHRGRHVRRRCCPSCRVIGSLRRASYENGDGTGSRRARYGARDRTTFDENYLSWAFRLASSSRWGSAFLRAVLQRRRRAGREGASSRPASDRRATRPRFSTTASSPGRLTQSLGHVVKPETMRALI